MAKPQTPETRLKRAVVQLLKTYRIVTWPLTAGMGSHPGLPDRFGVLQGGRLLAIEFKRPAGVSETGRKIPQGELSDDQIRVKEQIEAAGGLYIVCRSLDDIFTGLGLGGRLF